MKVPCTIAVIACVLLQLAGAMPLEARGAVAVDVARRDIGNHVSTGQYKARHDATDDDGYYGLPGSELEKRRI
ncbi:hypothetical protein FOMPIDRAFT_86506 [Fomitopsis schrenkii]|uniref:Uncharacterized protein n=1 Tax=Fomitopsis schrenkii TaxID=2126942 RepID=S8DW83_FOMSC|nr:hypothetical protein FOMPIDRAFT_86506 [Fomitopsis schrenkii]